MEKEFIPYEEALAMKELGFDEPCFAYFSLSHTSENYTFHICGEYTHYRDHYINFVGNGLRNSDLKVYPTGRKGNCMTAPLWQQAFRWFSKSYQLSGAVNDRLLTKGVVEAYWRILVNRPDSKIKSYANFAKTYEEAQLACLQKLIKIVKDETTR